MTIRSLPFNRPQSRELNCHVEEPSLGELLDDPVLQILMARDGVDRASLERVVDAARLRLGLAPMYAAALFEADLCAECRV